VRPRIGRASQEDENPPSLPTEARLRRDALAIFGAGLAEVEPASLVSRHLRETSPFPGGSPGGRVELVAVGKAAEAMARGAVEVLGPELHHLLLVTPEGPSDPGAGTLPVDVPVQRVHGGHPTPTSGSLAAARAVLERTVGLEPGDTLLLLLSGGGSALMALPPPGISLSDLVITTERLLRSGAHIDDLNAVRKHLDRVKGGRLAQAAAPGRVVALVLSDVAGDRADVIASGPVSPDPTTFADAVRVLTSRGIWPSLPDAVRRHLEAGMAGRVPETPKPSEPLMTRTDWRLVGNNRTALEGALKEARARGYRVRLDPTPVTGEAREVGRELGRQARRTRRELDSGGDPVCLLVGGETTVRVSGEGRGGPNQELALGAARALEGLEGVLLLSAGTDGIDGPTDAAGAVADGATLDRAASMGLPVETALARNDAYSLFDRTGDLVFTGPTGTNVMDLIVCLIVPARPRV
jgi:glycerate 2-kinase